MGLVVLVPPLVVLALVVTLGYGTISRSVSAGFVAWLKDASVVGRYLGGITAELAVKLTRWISHQIGAEWKDLERLGVAWFSGLYQWAALVITNALEWPVYFWRFQNWLLFTYLPKLLLQVPHAVAGTVTRIVTRVRTIERTVVKLPKLSKAAAKALIAAAVATYVHPFLRDLLWLRRHFHAITAVLPRVIPIPHVPTFPNIWKRIRALEKKLAVPLGIAAVVAALGRLGLGWIRCNKVRRLGKAACGMDSSLIDELILGGLAIFSVVSVVEFASELRKIEDEAVGIMGRLVREWPA